MKRSSKKNAVISLALAMVVALTGALAFLTASDSKTNTFTVGEVDIELTEPNWVPDYDSDNDGVNDTLLNIIPNQVIRKDPTITNTGSNDAYVYIMVEVPKAYKTDIVFADGEGNFSTESKNHYPLFTFETNDGWTLVDSQIASPSNYYPEEAYDYYLYAYNSKISPNEDVTLFDSVKFANITNEFKNAITNEKIIDLDIKVTGYAIQSDFYGEEASDASSAWKLYVNQNDWSWPSNKYDGIVDLNYVDNNNDLLHSETVYANAPISLYYDNTLAQDGYTFDWVDRDTNEVAYSGMSIQKDTTLAPSYTETGYGTQPSDFFNLQYYNGKVELKGVDTEHPNYLTNSLTTIIPATITFTVPENFSPFSTVVDSTAGKIELNSSALEAGKTYTLPVDSIGTEAFYNNSDIETLIVSDSITYIASKGLGRMPNLLSISLPYGLKTISWGGFSSCESLYEIKLPATITSIQQNTFYNCISLETIDIPESVTRIDNGAFQRCSSLDNVTIPDSVTNIGSYAFGSCTNLKSIKLSKNLTELSAGLFSGCYNLTSIEIPDGVTTISDSAFFNTGLVSVTVPESVTSIKYKAFNNTKSLTSITLPSQNVVFGEDALSVTGLKDVVIPDGTTQLPVGLFRSCKSLTSVTIPASVTSINDYTFGFCTALSDVYFEGTEEQWNAINISSTYNEALSTATIHFES